MDYIINKYKFMVRKKAKAMYLLGGENDDLIQEGMIGLFKAIRDYDVNQENSFQSFADLCISRQMYTAVQNSNRQKHLPLNTYISIYSQAMTTEEGSEEYTDTGVVIEAMADDQLYGRLASKLGEKALAWLE